MSILDGAAEDRMKLLLIEVSKLAKLEVGEYTTDLQKGTLEIDGITFGMAENKLRIEGVCPKCTQDVWSVPITRLADLLDLSTNFRPMKHHCMDV